MADPLVTLSTDFGEASPYAAALTGALLSVNPAARLVDLSHRLPPQNVRHLSYFLAHAVPFFPAGTVHVAVVDPGVGGERALLLAEAGGQRLLAPDNGCLTDVLRVLGGAPVVRRLQERRYWRAEVSATFHGRDILAPVAGHLTLGVEPAAFGPVVTEWVRLANPVPVRTADGWAGEVAFVDDFGNLITNLPAEALDGAARVTVGGQEVPRRVRTYADAVPGEVVALASSGGMLEVAVVNGSAAVRLRAEVGADVRVDHIR